MNLEQSCSNSITLHCKLSGLTVPVDVEIQTTESYVICVEYTNNKHCRIGKVYKEYNNPCTGLDEP